MAAALVCVGCRHTGLLSGSQWSQPRVQGVTESCFMWHPWWEYWAIWSCFVKDETWFQNLEVHKHKHWKRKGVVHKHNTLYMYMLIDLPPVGGYIHIYWVSSPVPISALQRPYPFGHSDARRETHLPEGFIHSGETAVGGGTWHLKAGWGRNHGEMWVS